MASIAKSNTGALTQQAKLAEVNKIVSETESDENKRARMRAATSPFRTGAFWAFATTGLIILVLILIYIFNPNFKNAVNGVLDDVGACGECSASSIEKCEKL